MVAVCHCNSKVTMVAVCHCNSWVIMVAVYHGNNKSITKSYKTCITQCAIVPLNLSYIINNIANIETNCQLNVIASSLVSQYLYVNTRPYNSIYGLMSHAYHVYTTDRK